MIKHTLEISQRPARISLRNRQLVIQLGEGEEDRSYACEDVGMLILQHPGISLSSAILNALLNAGAVIMICNEKHLPSGLLLPTLSHTELVPRMMAQLDAKLPARKQAWRAIVRAKIESQARLIEGPQQKRLLNLAENVKSGDTENAEAQAAKIYWSSLFPDRYILGDFRDFSSDSLFNVLLNYGYSVLRAATARAIVTAGLQPALGVFHHRRDNPFCLADDLIEPLRPLVDQTVRAILNEHSPENGSDLISEHRRKLLSLLTYEVRFKDSKGPLMAVMPRYIASFFRLLTRESSDLHCPVY